MQDYSVDTVSMKTDEASQAYEHIKKGGLIVCPTRVGYILVGNTGDALIRKFELKQRPLRKSAVVLTKHSALDAVAQVPEKHRPFIDAMESTKHLCGFIMERREDAFSKIDDKTREMTKQPDGTSCFVINHGAYSEYLVDQAEADDAFIFASSANPSGTGNRGRFQNVGERILGGVDYAIEHDEYVAQRYSPGSGEQGVMVSLMQDRPVIIRKGLNLEIITEKLDEIYGTDGWDMDHGAHP